MDHKRGDNESAGEQVASEESHGSRDIKGFIPTRQSLLSRLKDWDDHESWKLFFDTYGKLIYGAAAKAGLSDAEAQDVVQETIISVSKSMPGFRYDPARGSFKGWLHNLTRWRIQDQFRKRMPTREWEDLGRKGVGARMEAAGLVSDSAWEEAWFRNLMDAAVERVKKRVEPRQFQIFDCYVLQDWPARKVAKTLRVSVGRVYLAKHRIGALIKKELEHLERSVM